MQEFSHLKLENQICFSLYATSRVVMQQYKPLLNKLQLTYPQYLVLLVLWETNDIPVKEISKKLLLKTNTLTPLLKRLENNGVLTRKRSKKDERVVIISLTEKGEQLKNKAAKIPEKLTNELDCNNIKEEEIVMLKQLLDNLLNKMCKTT
jgi:DNA-binding MarR family transcriptional regulator